MQAYFEQNGIALYNGDCRALLSAIPDCSVDSCVTDPPYLLGFMNRAWDRSGISYQVEVWKEVYRILKPGAHLLAFGGTRTYHRLAVAIEDAGFEIRDSLHWMYGSGFPKSLDVSKAIDKAAGEERERIRGVRSGVVGPTYAQDDWSKEFKDSVLSTEPITTLARQWSGWGTALKPAHEPIVLAQKPVDEVSSDELYQLTGWGWWCSEKKEGDITTLTRRALCSAVRSHRLYLNKAHEVVNLEDLGEYQPFTLQNFAANALKWGTGALNIDACRIGQNHWTKRDGEHSGSEGGHLQQIKNRQAGVVRESNLGRWPSNVIFSHDPNCDGKCVEGCPVAELDRQSGESTSARGVNGGKLGARIYGRFESEVIGSNAGGLGDSGGASRFYHIAEWSENDLTPFIYVAKASRTERDSNLEDSADTIMNRVNPGGLERGPRWAPITVKNSHPTVKPISLMRYLLRLVTPPGGTSLDHFSGSGTTLIGAQREGFKAVGIELSADYCAIAAGRLREKELPLLRQIQAEQVIQPSLLDTI